MANVTTGRRTVFDQDGNGASFSIEVPGSRIVSAQGTFGSGTVKMQVFCGMNVAGDTELWRDFAGFTALTAVGHQLVAFGIGRYRFVLSGATGPSIAAFCQD